MVRMCACHGARVHIWTCSSLQEFKSLLMSEGTRHMPPSIIISAPRCQRGSIKSNPPTPAIETVTVINLRWRLCRPLSPLAAIPVDICTPLTCQRQRRMSVRCYSLKHDNFRLCHLLSKTLLPSSKATLYSIVTIDDLSEEQVDRIRCIPVWSFTNEFPAMILKWLSQCFAAEVPDELVYRVNFKGNAL